MEDSGDWGMENADHLAGRVRLFFAHGPLRGLRLIEVQVIESAVVLSGQAATFRQKLLATAFARRVAGVGEVKNRLKVAKAGLSTIPLRPAKRLEQTEEK